MKKNRILAFLISMLFLVASSTLVVTASSVEKSVPMSGEPNAMLLSAPAEPDATLPLVPAEPDATLPLVPTEPDATLPLVPTEPDATLPSVPIAPTPPTTLPMPIGSGVPGIDLIVPFINPHQSYLFARFDMTWEPDFFQGNNLSQSDIDFIKNNVRITISGPFETFEDAQSNINPGRSVSVNFDQMDAGPYLFFWDYPGDPGSNDLGDFIFYDGIYSMIWETDGTAWPAGLSVTSEALTSMGGGIPYPNDSPTLYFGALPTLNDVGFSNTTPYIFMLSNDGHILEDPVAMWIVTAQFERDDPVGFLPPDISLPHVPSDPDATLPPVPTDPDISLPQVPTDPDISLPPVPTDPDISLPLVPTNPDISLPQVPPLRPDIPEGLLPGLPIIPGDPSMPWLPPLPENPEDPWFPIDPDEPWRPVDPDNPLGPWLPWNPWHPNHPDFGIDSPWHPSHPDYNPDLLLVAGENMTTINETGVPAARLNPQTGDVVASTPNYYIVQVVLAVVGLVFSIVLAKKLKAA